MTVKVALLFPDLLGTYGDSGNAVILTQRLRWRGIDADMLTIRSGEAVPDDCQIYVVGGGEDLPQYQAARQLSTGSLATAVDNGAVVLAVCAGMQILGRRFTGPGGKAVDGVGLIDVATEPGVGPRMVGEIVVDPDPELHLPALSGYENHAGVTRLGPGAAPLGRARVGAGNGGGTGVDGAVSGRVLGTYLHGPVLARNPALADLLLTWAVGALYPLDDTESDALRTERLAAVAGAGESGRSRWRRRR